MTDDEKITNKKDEQEEMIESDIEQEDDSVCTGDKSNPTTDDEFYNELMAAPPEHEDHLIPDECKDERSGIEHLTSCLNRRHNSCPIVFSGPLKDALKAAFSPKEIKERRPLLVYVNNDKSLCSNLFCKQLLCHDMIVEFLLANYVLWAWDVTFKSNGEMLNEICKTAFVPCNLEQTLGTKSVDQYPLLFGVRRDKEGDHLFKSLIVGSNKIPVIDEFLAGLMEFKDQFDLGEEVLERAKEENKRQMTKTLFQQRDLKHRDYHHSSSMLSPMSNDRNSQYSRYSSNNNNNEHMFSNLMNVTSTFQQMNIHGNDDSSDDDDDDEQTPTVERSLPKFSE